MDKIPVYQLTYKLKMLKILLVILILQGLLYLHLNFISKIILISYPTFSHLPNSFWFTFTFSTIYPLIAGSRHKSQGGLAVSGRKGKAVIQRSGATDIRRITSRWRVSTERRRSYFRFRIDSNIERILNKYFWIRVTSVIIVNCLVGCSKFGSLNCNGWIMVSTRSILPKDIIYKSSSFPEVFKSTC